MRLALGGLGWRPVDFWGATMTEFFEAINGHNEANGGTDSKPSGMSPEEAQALFDKYGA